MTSHHHIRNQLSIAKKAVADIPDNQGVEMKIALDEILKALNLVQDRIKMLDFQGK